MTHNETCEVLCMDIFASHKKNRVIFLHIIILLIIICNFTYAGNLIEVDGFTMYKTNSGEYAKDCFVWLDLNGDSVKECYRFDEKGHIAKNYVGHDNRRTNELGQLIENGLVMKKLPSGIVMKGDGTPEVAVEDIDGNVINRTDRKVLDNLPFVADGRNGNMILTKKLKDEVEIPIDTDEATVPNIIYSNGGKGAISTITSDESSKLNNQIIAGKNIKNYITAKNNVKTDVEKVIIFGNDIWEDVIELRGNNSSIKINIKNFNYIYFEVAEGNHVVDIENDEDIKLEVNIDGKLYETLDEFVENEPQIEEIEELAGKVLELKVRIDGKNKYRKVYIRNGRLKKIREKDE